VKSLATLVKMVKATQPLLADPFAVFTFLMMVYFQLKWFYQYSANLRQEADRRDQALREMHLKNQKTLDQFASRLDATRSGATKIIQPLEGRLEALEGVFKGLITAEAAVATAEGARLRGLLKSGAYLGWKQYELQLHAQLGEAVQREAAWQKAAGWV